MGYTCQPFVHFGVIHTEHPPPLPPMQMPHGAHSPCGSSSSSQNNSRSQSPMRLAAQSEVAGSNSESKESKKRGRPKGSKDKGPRKHKLTHANVLWALSVPTPRLTPVCRPQRVFTRKLVCPMTHLNDSMAALACCCGSPLYRLSVQRPRRRCHM